MVETTVTIPTPDGPMQAYDVRPDAAGAPALIVVQEAYGVNPHIRDVTRRFAGLGYHAVAPEFFHRSGDGLEFSYDDFSKVMPVFAKLTNDTLETDLRAALAYLGGDRVTVVGFCVGGFATFLAACRLPIAAAVAFYGGGLVRVRPGFGVTPLIGEAGKISAPILLHFGAADQGISQADVDTVAAALKEHGKRHEIAVYPGAGHGFFCDDRASYHAGAAAAAWRKTLDFLIDLDPRLRSHSPGTDPTSH